jgi:hypothetical protein
MEVYNTKPGGTQPHSTQNIEKEPSYNLCVYSMRTHPTPALSHPIILLTNPLPLRAMPTSCRTLFPTLNRNYRTYPFCFQSLSKLLHAIKTKECWEGAKGLCEGSKFTDHSLRTRLDGPYTQSLLKISSRFIFE